MRITFLGHAGLHIEARAGSILCDPWKNPAYFGSWFVFPDNTGLDWDRYGRVDYLYVSHLHQDHFDPALLADHVSRAATVLLPDFRCQISAISWSGWGLPGSARSPVGGLSGTAGSG